MLTIVTAEHFRLMAEHLAVKEEGEHTHMMKCRQNVLVLFKYNENRLPLFWNA